MVGLFLSVIYSHFVSNQILLYVCDLHGSQIGQVFINAVSDLFRNRANISNKIVIVFHTSAQKYKNIVASYPLIIC